MATPTSGTSSESGDEWQMDIKAVDNSNASDTGTTSRDLNTLYYFQIGTSIDYSNVGLGATSSEKSTNATNAGNAPLDLGLSGVNMEETGGHTIAVGQQKYSSSSNMGNWVGIALTGTPIDYKLNLIKPTATTSNSTDILYWMIKIPATQYSGIYTGTNTIEVVDDSCDSYIPSGSWSFSITTIVRDISNSSSTATTTKDIYCDNDNCVLWTYGASAPSGTICIQGGDVYGNILWEKTDTSEGAQYGEDGNSLSGDQIGGTHAAGLTVGDNGANVGGENWLNRYWTSGDFPAMAACKAKGFGWRSPTILELDSIRDQAKGSSPYTRLPNFTVFSYWSSSEVNSINGYRLYFLNGNVYNTNSKSTYYNVRCVRGQ